MVFGSNRDESEIGSNGLPPNDIYMTTRENARTMTTEMRKNFLILTRFQPGGRAATSIPPTVSTVCLWAKVETVETVWRIPRWPMSTRLKPGENEIGLTRQARLTNQTNHACHHVGLIL